MKKVLCESCGVCEMVWSVCVRNLYVCDLYEVWRKLCGSDIYVKVV